MLNEYLLSGFQMVQNKGRELQQVAHPLKLLLEFGAKWKDGVLLENQMAPHHLICRSHGDNHELLDLIPAYFDRTLINSKSHDWSTALLYAVRNVNLKCVKSLIANGANVNVENYSCACYPSLSSSQQVQLLSPITRLQPNSEYSSIVMTEILALLLDSGVNVNKRSCISKPKPIEYAIYQGNVRCVKKLIEKEAWLDTIDRDGVYTSWSKVAGMGSADLLKCMLDHGINKECTDLEGQSLSSYTVRSGNVEAMQYLLDLGVTMTSYALGTAPGTDDILCKGCGKSRLLINIDAEAKRRDPYMVACKFNMLPVVQLLEDYGNHNFKSMNALRYAVLDDSLEVVYYLLGKYMYPLNNEYALKIYDNIVYRNILIEACDQVIDLLVDHGADPNRSICEDERHRFRSNVGLQLEKLMKKWNVHENNVTPLKIQCRS